MPDRLELQRRAPKGPTPSMTTVSQSLDPIASEARHRAAWLSLYGGILVFVGKAAAYFLTSSTAIFSDALESIVNIVAASFLVYSIRLATTPADRDHPYGHGKIEFFSAGVEGTLIVIAGILILLQSGYAIWSGPVIHRLDLGIWILAAFGAVNAGIGWHLVRVGKRVGSLALRADGMHLLTDVLTTLGVVAGLFLVRLTGWIYLDPIVAIAVALNILRTGWQISREAVGGLMDEADLEFLEQITGRLERFRKPWWIDIHSLRSWRSGSVHHVDFHLTVPRYYDAERLHEIDELLKEETFSREFMAGDVIIHFDPCRPRHCRGCSVANCPTRGDDFVDHLPFTVLDATRQDEDLDDGTPIRSLASREGQPGIAPSHEVGTSDEEEDNHQSRGGGIE
jgi:cation diffusion facilitator family transporter